MNKIDEIMKDEGLVIVEWPIEEFDENGNKIFYKNSDSYCWRAKYDANGNVVDFKDNKGIHKKYKYDDEGNEILQETNGKTWVTEYDSNSNIIYKSYPNGEEYWYEYNSDMEQIYFRDYMGNEWRKHIYEESVVTYTRNAGRFGDQIWKECYSDERLDRTIELKHGHYYLNGVLLDNPSFGTMRGVME